MTGAIGAALYPRRGETLDELVRRRPRDVRGQDVRRRHRLAGAVTVGIVGENVHDQCAGPDRRRHAEESKPTAFADRPAHARPTPGADRSAERRAAYLPAWLLSTTLTSASPGSERPSSPDVGAAVATDSVNSDRGSRHRRSAVLGGDAIAAV
jgi:hypothetical protein